MIVIDENQRRKEQDAPNASPGQGFGFGPTSQANAAPVYQHGHGQYSDNPSGMQLGALQVNRPTAPGQNMAARSAEPQPYGYGFDASRAPGNISSGADSARRVADIYREAAYGSVPQPRVQAPDIAHSGNDWTARNALRNAEVASKTMRGDWALYRDGVIDQNGRTRPGADTVHPGQRKFHEMVKNDLALQVADAKGRQSAMEENARLGAQGLTEWGLKQRAKMDAKASEAKLGFDLAKQGMEARRQAAQDEMSRARLGLDARKLGLQEAELAHKMQGGQGDQLPTAALKMQQEELDAMGTASAIKADLGAIGQQLDSGELQLGPIRNTWNRARNALGFSTPESRNLASFDASLEKIRNDSLRLNKGVQTEGDAVRAMNEVTRSTTDPALIRQRLDELQSINQRAADMRAENVNQIRQNFGARPLDMSAHRNVQPAIGQRTQGTQQPQRAQQAADDAPPVQQQQAPRVVSADEWLALNAGSVYVAPDGSLRRKK